MPDLWPAEFGEADVKPPVVVLREQADYLAKKTGGLVLGKVLTSRDSDQFVHQFVLVAPVLDNYSYYLFSVKHSVELYPLELSAHTLRQTWKDVPDEAGFNNALVEVLQAEPTKRIIRSLMLQSQGGQGETA
jgi:hypothetical protein